MLSSQQILEDAARDGSIDIEEWPRVLETVLQKLHDIVHNDFPVPNLPPPGSAALSIDPEFIAASPARAPSLSQNDDTTESIDPLSQSSTTTNKENTAPPNPSSRSTIPSSSATSDARTLHPRETEPTPELPPDWLNLYQSSTKVLRNSFSHSPPYTIQRLAELILNPRRHYRYLPPYLAAIDRTVSVSSPVSDFPLPQLHLNSTNGGGFLTNGDTLNGTIDPEMSSDESLGGALLTPIPWLRRDTSLADAAAHAQRQDGELRSEGSETMEGPNGAGRIETVSVTVNGIPSTTHSPASDDERTLMTTEQELRAEGAVTQGELLRQEQEAGVVPVGQNARRVAMAANQTAGRDSLASTVEDLEKPEEHPHARGPDVIGMEDMGPQEGSLGALKPLNMEAAVGRSRSKSPQPPEVDTEVKEEEAVKSQDGSKVEEIDAEGDVKLDDVRDATDKVDHEEGTETKEEEK